MPNTRRCPFYNCERMIDPSIFACRHHWAPMEDHHRMEIWQIYTDHLNGKLSLEDLVKRQREIVLKYTPQIIPGSAAGVANSDLISLAKLVERYIAKRKEYSAVKEQMLDKKKQVGMVLGKIENELSKTVHSILHPQQKQPTLFDPDVKEGSAKLPD